YFNLRDILATLTDDIKHKTLTFNTAEAKHSYEHPINLNEIILDGEVVGKIGIVHPVVSKKIDKKGNVVFAEIDIEKFAEANNDSISYSEPSKFPPMTYDLSVELKPGTFFSKLMECWKGLGEDILKDTKIVDTYDTDTIHSITIRFEFSSNERTLSSNEVQDIMDKVIENLKNIGVNLRT
ncbi:MAG: phenylalanine--tRNA ligase subunit beta, partial [Ruminococcus sp.]|nr:phenylalanine--tRNA ligase subunit beta [Ruminococcus sp.]